jgi:uncharacterized membrane protein
MNANSDSYSASNHHDDRKMRLTEIFISYVLRIGVVISLIFIVGGMLLSFFHHNEYVSSLAALERLTQPGAAFPHTLSDILTGVRNTKGQAFVAFGLIVLILTPIVRVAVSTLFFIYQGDKIFVLITLVVLVILSLSFLIGTVI